MQHKAGDQCNGRQMTAPRFRGSYLAEFLFRQPPFCAHEQMRRQQAQENRQENAPYHAPEQQQTHKNVIHAPGPTTKPRITQRLSGKGDFREGEAPAEP